MERRKAEKRRLVEKRGAGTLENRELATDAKLATISVASTTRWNYGKPKRRT